MQLIDLSQTIEPGMQLFSESVPQPQITPWMTHAQAAASGRYAGCSCEITQVQMLTSVGTYLDSPFHFDPDGPSIEQLALEQLVLPGVVVDCTGLAGGTPIGPDVLEGVEIEGRAVLFNTGWSHYWGKPEYYNYPFLNREMALALRDRGAKMAGIDCLAVDTLSDPARPMHVTLLHSRILIAENLTNLDALPATGFTFHAAPVKVAGAAAFPVRAYAVVAEGAL